MDFCDAILLLIRHFVSVSTCCYSGILIHYSTEYTLNGMSLTSTSVTHRWHFFVYEYQYFWNYKTGRCLMQESVSMRWAIMAVPLSTPVPSRFQEEIWSWLYTSTRLAPSAARCERFWTTTGCRMRSWRWTQWWGRRSSGRPTERFPSWWWMATW